MALRSLSLCAGVAGIDLGLRLADPTIRTVCYVEWSHFPAAVIAARIEDQTLDDAPVWDDVGTFDGRPWRGAVDLITAGFPCQPVSLAGKRLGMADERFIWGDVERIIAEVAPRYVLLENVPGIVSADDGWFVDRVLSGLVNLGFDCEWDLFSAEETGAPHRRLRWFCLAYTNGQRRQQESRSPHGDEATDEGGTAQHDHVLAGSRAALANAGDRFVPEPGRGSQGRDGTGPAGEVLGDADGAGREEHGWRVAVRPEQSPAQRRGGVMADSDRNDRRVSDGSRWWPESAAGRVYPPARNDRAGWAAVEASLEPAVCRDADGLAPGMDASLFAYRNDRLRAVGNGVVPLTAAIAWRELNRRIRE